jgi:hypothetical protein
VYWLVRRLIAWPWLLVPIVMGEGNRPFFGTLSSQDVLLGNPTVCFQGDRVTHLVFPVLR